MTIMITEVYDALIAAGAPEDHARKAAETLANYDNRLVSVESRLTALTWAVGINITLTLAVLARVFALHAGG